MRFFKDETIFSTCFLRTESAVSAAARLTNVVLLDDTVLHSDVTLFSARGALAGGHVFAQTLNRDVLCPVDGFESVLLLFFTGVSLLVGVTVFDSFSDADSLADTVWTFSSLSFSTFFFLAFGLG